jgi:hypothetical protein
MKNAAPGVLTIDNGRQLFVDDYLIEETNLTRQYHYPKYYPANPVLFADKDWEFQRNGSPYAAPFSDGVWYDEKENIFKMWYKAGGGKYGDPAGRANITCYAVSKDGMKWEKPSLNIIAGTNIVDTHLRDSNTIWLDKSEKCPSKRFKMFAMESRISSNDQKWHMTLRYSAHGICWSECVVESKSFQDRSTVFYNPFAKVWVWSIRNSDDKKTRLRSYLEDTDPEQGIKRLCEAPYPTINNFIKHWFAADEKDPYHPNHSYKHIKPQVYNHDAIAYESIILGFFTIWQGPENEICERLGMHKRNEIVIGYSRDGFNWNRPDRNRFLSVNDSEVAWNNGNIQSVGGNPIIVGDELFFYCSARQTSKAFWDANMSTGLAKLRRDGFASLNASAEEGFILTKKIVFGGDYLFVNANTCTEYLKVEVLDTSGMTIKGFEKENSIITKIQDTKSSVSWRNKSDLKEVKNKVVQLRFYLKSGELYAFWVSTYKSGESGGYTAGGGPGLHPSGIDQV